MTNEHTQANGQGPNESPEEDPKEIATSNTFADISIRNHVFAWMLMFGLMGFGTIAFSGYRKRPAARVTAARTAAIRLVGSATPRPAISNAVP